MNRYYVAPTLGVQPTIFGAKAAVEQQKELGKLEIYIDFHAHAGKRGWFIFGNHLYGENQVNNILLPKLISLNSINFDFEEWGFSEGMMNWVDRRDGLSREGSGRVGIWKATNINNCYTLECHYVTGVRTKKLNPKIDKESGEIIPEEDVTNIDSEMYQSHDLPVFNQG